MERSAGKSFRTDDQVVDDVVSAGRRPGLGLAGRHRARQLGEQAHRAVAESATRSAEAPPRRPAREAEAEEPGEAPGGAVAAVVVRYD